MNSITKTLKQQEKKYLNKKFKRKDKKRIYQLFFKSSFYQDILTELESNRDKKFSSGSLAKELGLRITKNFREKVSKYKALSSSKYGFSFDAFVKESNLPKHKSKDDPRSLFSNNYFLRKLFKDESTSVNRLKGRIILIALDIPFEEWPLFYLRDDFNEGNTHSNYFPDYVENLEGLWYLYFRVSKGFGGELYECPLLIKVDNEKVTLTYKNYIGDEIYKGHIDFEEPQQAFFHLVQSNNDQLRYIKIRTYMRSLEAVKNYFVFNAISTFNLNYEGIIANKCLLVKVNQNEKNKTIDQYVTRRVYPSEIVIGHLKFLSDKGYVNVFTYLNKRNNIPVEQFTSQKYDTKLSCLRLDDDIEQQNPISLLQDMLSKGKWMSIVNIPDEKSFSPQPKFQCYIWECKQLNNNTFTINVKRKGASDYLAGEINKFDGEIFIVLKNHNGYVMKRLSLLTSNLHVSENIVKGVSLNASGDQVRRREILFKLPNDTNIENVPEFLDIQYLDKTEIIDDDYKLYLINEDNGTLSYPSLEDTTKQIARAKQSTDLTGTYLLYFMNSYSKKGDSLIRCILTINSLSFVKLAMFYPKNKGDKAHIRKYTGYSQIINESLYISLKNKKKQKAEIILGYLPVDYADIKFTTGILTDTNRSGSPCGDACLAVSLQYIKRQAAENIQMRELASVYFASIEKSESINLDSPEINWIDDILEGSTSKKVKKIRTFFEQYIPLRKITLYDKK